MNATPDDSTASGGQAPHRQTLDWHAGDMPYSREFDDHFYCRADGRLECGHVFLAGNGLPERWTETDRFAIGELGFGTGLNVCETARQWKATHPPGARLDITSFERFPLRRDEIDRALARWPEIDEERRTLTALWPDDPAGTIVRDLGDGAQLTVVFGAALESLDAWDTPFDAWFLDGFAPARNPDMWSDALMRRVFERTVPGGTFSTYAAAGFVRRNLQAAGFTVERRQGFAGKRECLGGWRRQDG